MKKLIAFIVYLFKREFGNEPSVNEMNYTEYL